MNEQEALWAGQFGTDYTIRNADVKVEHRMTFWDRIFDWGEVDTPESVIEFGANTGINLEAISRIFAENELSPPELAGVEINPHSYELLKNNRGITAPFQAFQGSILDFSSERQWDLAFTCGVLIHVAPDDLPRAYDALNRASKRWVFMAEYHSPKPREIEYRGHQGALWSRDFGAEFLDRHPHYKIVDYGFAWHRDPDCPLDDLVWTLVERR